MPSFTIGVFFLLFHSFFFLKHKLVDLNKRGLEKGFVEDHSNLLGVGNSH